MVSFLRDVLVAQGIINHKSRYAERQKERENKPRPTGLGKLGLTSAQKEAETFHLSGKHRAYRCLIESIGIVIQ